MIDYLKRDVIRMVKKKRSSLVSIIVEILAFTYCNFSFILPYKFVLRRNIYLISKSEIRMVQWKFCFEKKRLTKKIRDKNIGVETQSITM